jgi:hypothetical protein
MCPKVPEAESELAMKISRNKNIFACGLLGAGLMLLCPSPSIAQSDTTQFLIQDFKAFEQVCPGPASSYPPSCANQLSDLKRRQYELHLTDADLAKATLVYDFNEFPRGCPPPPSTYSQTCTNAWAELKRRQQELHLTDADLQALGVNATRAGRWD